MVAKGIPLEMGTSKAASPCRGIPSFPLERIRTSVTPTLRLRRRTALRFFPLGFAIAAAFLGFLGYTGSPPVFISGDIPPGGAELISLPGARVIDVRPCILNKVTKKTARGNESTSYDGVCYVVIWEPGRDQHHAFFDHVVIWRDLHSHRVAVCFDNAPHYFSRDPLWRDRFIIGPS